MRSERTGPYNLGSEEMISINSLVDLISDIAGKTLVKKHIDGPLGVRGRNSDNTLIANDLGWKPSQKLRTGLETTFAWIQEKVNNNCQDIK